MMGEVFFVNIFSLGFFLLYMVFVFFLFGFVNCLYLFLFVVFEWFVFYG